ncbi:Protein ltv1 [Vermiconidia calcicola]|uniref:Protein ltv1 n=1 Tax=Vermiconidia calcicola TaxID=1690605 RepID=A0ACC3NIU9_9PEZI|nr:Protein ltv1 [Vermiconidia calcicola]
MPRRKFINKKDATTFALVHRAGNDAAYYSEDANPMVFAEKSTIQPKSLRRARDEDYAYSSAGSVVSSREGKGKGKQRGDLEDEFGMIVRPNEGEAAQHGVFYDDTEYDYMQHMRDLGSGEGGVAWVEASAPPQQQAKPRKQKLEDALRSLDMDSSSSVGTSASQARSLLPEEVLPSEFVRRGDYQDQQDVPDEIAGFRPDMDPRLREVLEALEDEEFVDEGEDGEEFWGELTVDGEVGDWGDILDDDDEDLGLGEELGEGWESDDTIKATSSPPPAPALEELKEAGEMIEPPTDTQAPPPADPMGGAWLDEFKKFKNAPQPTTTTPLDLPTAQSSQKAPTNAAKRKKKRNAAASTNFTMSSVSLARSEQMRLLDSRFDKAIADYSNDPLSALDEMDEGSSQVSGVTGLSKATGASRASRASNFSTASGWSTTSSRAPGAPNSMREDFDSIVDSFLAGSEDGPVKGRGKRRGRNGEGIAELDRIRRELGPARVKTAVKSGQ